MLEWVWCQMRLDECLQKEDDVIWIWILASLIGSLFAQLGGKSKNTLAFRIRLTRGRWPLLGVEAKERNIYEKLDAIQQVHRIWRRTRLAMPKTICAPDSSSLKLGSGATEGVLD